ncbi:hypothetical protein DIURU_003886 [Diutina rugosa]|uniref:Cytochrome b-c1 complex subunit 2, mitochondrial n=1 Tax=Diutina rugosa TaxID=5481 RepID=A0A642UJK9_DIURU|nr:uncharacterized protein DIURU_003886 [Diutina rugosa]KAA8900235.1 hypothetical protein DIURU_003886 [Diutina rugosa]
MYRRVSSRAYSTIKLNTRESSGNLTTLTVKVNNAGSKAGAKPGLAHLYSKFNFLNTETKSALRFTRESELLGGQFSSTITRDAVLLKTTFLKQDLPYYVEALGATLASPAFRPHELQEVVLPVAKAEFAAANASNSHKAIEAAHAITYQRGYGRPLLYDGTQSVTVEDIRQFATDVVNSTNVEVFASGANESDLSKFIQESSFSKIPGGASENIPVISKSGAEVRIPASGESVAALAYAVKPEQFGAYEALSAALGNHFLGVDANSALASIKGAVSQLYKYEDAGLFVVTVKGEATQVAESIRRAKEAVETTSISAEAVKNGELSLALQSIFEFPHSVKISSDKPELPQFNYVAVGDVDVLPYANEL